MTPRSLVDRRGIRTILVGSALAGLLGATACAVASVSPWLAPAYLLLVAAILAAPRGPREPPQAPGTTLELRPSLAEEDGSPSPHPGAPPLGARAWAWLLRAGASIGRWRPSSPAPRRGAAAPRTGEETDSPASAGVPELGLDAQSDPAVSTAGSDDAGPGNLRGDPAAAAVPKPRKSRARSRKTAKSAVEPAPDSALVTWVRVGPGQYVRSDTIIQGQTPIEAPAWIEESRGVEAPALTPAPTPIEVPASVEEPPAAEAQVPTQAPPDVEATAPTQVTTSAEAIAPAEVQADAAEADPVTDRSEPAAVEPKADGEAGPVAEVPEADAPVSDEPALIAQPATDAPEAEIIPTHEGGASEALPTADLPATEPTAPEVAPEALPLAEEYGIAPSAFGTESPTGPLTSESPEADVLASIVPASPGAEPVRIADPDASAPGSSPSGPRPGERRRRARTITPFVPPGLVNRSPAGESRSTSSRRMVRGPMRPRAALRGPSSRDPRPGGDARRASGRRDHLRHAWRARSPPGSA